MRKLERAIIAGVTTLALTLAGTACAGPPFVTDDPEPVDYQHWEFYVASEHSKLESTNEFDFVAPEGGYQPSYQITYRASDQDWTGQEKRKFFVKSLGGQHYARIEITIMPDYNQNAAYDVEWFLNPAGSRNLEYSPDNAVQASQ